MAILRVADTLSVINMEGPAKSRLRPHVLTNPDIFETTRFVWTESITSHPGKRYMKKPFRSQAAQSHYES